MIATPGNQDIGIYGIQVCSIIHNFLNTKACTQFDLFVTPKPDLSMKPKFIINLEDKRVKVGDSLTYNLSEFIVSEGYLFDVSLDL